MHGESLKSFEIGFIGLKRRLLKKREHGDSRSVIHLCLETFEFIIKSGMYTPRYWVWFVRYVLFRLKHRKVELEGFVFLPKKYEIYIGENARIRIGKWVWIGQDNAIRCHEGMLHIGSNTVFGIRNTVNCYEGIHIGSNCLFADSVYIVDFDHNYWDPEMNIRTQGIKKKRINLEGDIWIGYGTCVLRGCTIGKGSVIGAMTLVNKDVPPFSVAGGVPCKVLHRRPMPCDQ